MIRSIAPASLLLAIVLQASVLHAQEEAAQQGAVASPPRQLLFEISGGAGYTGVDIEKWGGSSARNEELGLYQGDVRVFFAERAGYQIGLEGGHRYFMYYEVPWTPSDLQYDVSATRVAAVARRPITGMLALDVALAMYMFGDFTDLGVSGALAFRIPAGRITLPLHVRTDVVFDQSATIIAPGVTIGVGFRP